MFDSRTSLSSEVRDDIERFLENARNSNAPWANASIIPVHIRRNIKLAEAPSYGKTIFEYEPTCNGANDYMAVADWLHTGAISSEKTNDTLIAQAPAVCPEENAETATVIEQQ
jgi:chromosome partitioning protein